jgi:hypothetical protein
MLHTLQKSIFIFIVAFGIYNSSNAQWTSITPAYNGMLANDGAVSFSINGTGYLMCGSSTDQVYMYDTLLNSWSVYGTAPATMGKAFAMSFVINDKAYIIGGDTGGVPVSSVWQFDPANSVNPWTQKNNFPTGPRDAGFAFALTNTGYAGAGFDGNATFSDIWKYDQATDSWSALSTSIPINGLIFPSSFVSGDKGFILLGGTGTGVNETNKMWCLDGTNDSIYARANFPGTARQSAFAFGNSQYAFVGGGQAGYTTNYWNTWMYDIANNQWSAIPNVPLLGAAWSSAFTIGNSGYVGLGAKFVPSGLTGDDHFYKYNMDVTTLVNNIQKNSSTWTVYPNPVTDYLYFSGDFSPDAKIILSDATGRILFESSVPVDKKLMMDKYEKGLYTVSVIQDNVIESKIVVR